MSWKEVERDLKDLGADAREVVDDVRELGRDLSRTAQVASDDVVTAEYLATGGALEWFSGWIEDSLESVAIASDQWRFYVEDGVDTLVSLSQISSPADLTGVARDHVERRRRHLGEGVRRGIDLARRNVRRSFEPVRTVWRPFLGMVRDDLR